MVVVLVPYRSCRSEEWVEDRGGTKDARRIQPEDVRRDDTPAVELDSCWIDGAAECVKAYPDLQVEEGVGTKAWWFRSNNARQHNQQRNNNNNGWKMRPSPGIFSVQPGGAHANGGDLARPAAYTNQFKLPTTDKNSFPFNEDRSFLGVLAFSTHPMDLCSKNVRYVHMYVGHGGLGLR